MLNLLGVPSETSCQYTRKTSLMIKLLGVLSEPSSQYTRKASLMMKLTGVPNETLSQYCILYHIFGPKIMHVENVIFRQEWNNYESDLLIEMG